MDKDEIIKELSLIIRRHLPEKEFKVLLFGSWAKGGAEPTSDIDIGILGSKPVDDLVMLRIKNEARAIPTLRGIDVVDLRATSDRFREEVLSYARQL